jgi:CopA family copper-resistance protein
MSLSRRRFLGVCTRSLAAAAVPVRADGASPAHRGIRELRGDVFDLFAARMPVVIDGRRGQAITINGTLPAPLLRFREDERVTLRVHNQLDEDTSIHWHGLLVPFHMDGVPGVSFPGIAPGATFTYEFAVPQHGTYWYHSHSGLQEQLGHYGPIIIDPAGTDPVRFDREFVLVLSDWMFADPHRVFTTLKMQSDAYNFQHRTFRDLVRDTRASGLRATAADRAMWGRMRMAPTDLSDVTAAVYTYLVNGHSTRDNWTGAYEVGERLRLRIINASAMTIFNFRIPGLPMTVVQADGLNVRPIETDEFQIGIAETYDVLVEPSDGGPYAIVAESIDRSGQVVATLGARAGVHAIAPPLRPRPLLEPRDMAMATHGGHGAQSADHGDGAHAMHQDAVHDTTQAGSSVIHAHALGPGVDAIAEAPTRRLDHPGLGLEGLSHRTLSYAQLRSLDRNPDPRTPEREIEIHLTGNMERYMWSFDGVKFSEVVDPIVFHEDERLRVTLVNDTMMTHPIHLHGMYFDLVVDDGDHKPRKHTVNVKPGEILSFDVTADHPGDWAFHCHLLFHMHAGMMQVVSVRPTEDGKRPQQGEAAPTGRRRTHH